MRSTACRLPLACLALALAVATPGPASAPAQAAETRKVIRDEARRVSPGKVYSLDPQSGSLKFGDGVVGARPPAGAGNVRPKGGGQAGNLPGIKPCLKISGRC